ncbi:hypothetical protein IV78_GL000377 [Pediococcus acidilactici]|uniref:Uncharacterized protein n=1 Tax=Pediococcus acidilactici DSM 20284 TaxID=862514 RepID=E0NDR8_PEDAC|nr:hypothetical protein HMPREF0623_0440 [Pediococcus acidilactici DSM 20284]KRN17288.1 hypothetical protein IV78_GL000377 [Pediococcus acidilactici]GHC31166.1 hypothetical protein GCM10008920_02120 [Pediococcus acidilactici]
MNEMKRRGYQPNLNWFNPTYRGLNCPPYLSLPTCPLTHPIYPEHDFDYLAERLTNLRAKDIDI